MLEDIVKFDTIECDTRFLKKLKQFLKNKPIFCKVQMINNKVKIFYRELTYIHFELDYSLDEDIDECVKMNIKSISEYLYDNYFPIILIKEKLLSPLSVEEREKLQKQGIPLEEVLLKQKEKIIEKKFKIIKIIINNTPELFRNELFIENLETKKIGRYKLKIPVSIFLKRIHNKEIDEIEAGKLFLEKALFINRIYPRDEWKEYLEKEIKPKDLFEDIM